MSLTQHAEREGGAGASSLGLAHALVPRLSPGGYAAWRPAMENVLMRAGIAARDYKEANADWAALVEAVDRWTTADESASIAYALGRGTASSSSAAGPTTAEKEARRGATEAVARAKRAYALLYQALTDELRRLVASVPQGDAYGLWSWLEKRFQSTEQDNVGDLWDAFTQLAQESDESFDQYKARVDHVYGLLAHAKDKPSAGLYAHRLLWKLSARYNPAVLALKASGKLKEADKIDWDEIVAFVNNHERSEQRLNGDDTADGRAMAATTRGDRRGAHRDGAAETRDCFNCGETGHLARNCKKARRARQHEGHEGDDDDEAVASRESGTRREGPAASARRRGDGRNHRVAAVMALTSDSDEELEHEICGRHVHRSYAALAITAPEEQRPSGRFEEGGDQDGRGRPRQMARSTARRGARGGLRW
jgi:hypothetical protein